MFHKKEGGAGKRHRPFVMAYTGRWGTLPPTNVVRVLAPLEGAVTEGDGGMALRQYVAKVATPHPLRGSSPLGEPKSFGGECEIIWTTREKPDFMRVYAA